MRRVLKRIQKYTNKVDSEYLQKRYDKLIFKGHPGLDFFLFTVASASIAALGFMMNSPSVIIGAMVISPLLYPIVLIGSAISRKHWHESGKLTQMLLVGVVVALVTAVILAWLIPFTYNSEIHERLASSPLQYFLVAFFSGLAGTFAYYWPEVSESITGVGIAVALMPPLVMIGLAIGNTDMELFLKSGLIGVINIVGLVVAAIICSNFLWWYGIKQD